MAKLLHRPARAAVAVFVLLGGVCGAVSCSKMPDTDWEEPLPRVTITFASLETGTGTAQRFAEQFMERNPDIRVETKILPPISDFVHDAFVNELVNEDAQTDLYALDTIWIAEFAAAGWLKPLDGVFEPESLAKVMAKPLENAHYDGRLYALPWYTDSGVLFYRKDLLEEIGADPPETWAELAEQAVRLQRVGKVRYGYLFQGDKYEGLTMNFLELFWTNGGELEDGDGFRLNVPEAVETLRFMQHLLAERISPRDVLQYKESQSRERFLDGEAAFLRSGPIVWGLSATSPVKGKIGIAPLPVGPSGRKSATSIGGASIGLNARTTGEREAAAIRFMKFLISDEAQKQVALEHSRLPVARHAYEDADVLEFNPYYGDIGQMIEHAARFRPIAVHYSEISNVLQTGLHDALSRGIDAEAALAAMERLVRALPAAPPAAQ